MAAPATPAAPTAPPQAAGQNPPQAPPGAQAPPAAAAAEARKLRLKIEGKEVELPESEVIGLAQQGKAAGQRFQEAAALRKQAEELIAFAKANPREFFNRTGMNAREWAEKYLIEELEAEQMSPEQKKARANEEKLKAYEAEKKQREEEGRKAEMARLQAEHAQNYDKLFTAALHESGLPKTAFTVKRMAELQLANIKNRYELSAPQLAKIVREDYANEQKSLLSALDGDQLIEFLGADAVKKLSKAQIAKLKARGAGAGQTSGSAQAPRARQGEGGGLTWQEYKRRNRGR